MIIFQRFFFCIPIRIGCIIIGYILIIQGFTNIFFVSLFYESPCERLTKLWIAQSQVNIISGVLLLAGCFNVGSSYLCKRMCEKKEY